MRRGFHKKGLLTDGMSNYLVRWDGTYQVDPQRRWIFLLQESSSHILEMVLDGGAGLYWILRVGLIDDQRNLSATILRRRPNWR